MTRSFDNSQRGAHGRKVLGFCAGQSRIRRRIFGQAKAFPNGCNFFLNFRAALFSRKSSVCRRALRPALGRQHGRRLMSWTVLHSHFPLMSSCLFLNNLNVMAAADLFNWKVSSVFHHYFPPKISGIKT